MMRFVRSYAALTVLLLAGLALVGCNVSRAGAPTENGSIDDSPQGGGDAGTRVTATPAATDMPAGPTITPTPLPPPPDGWSEYQSDEVGLSLYYPPGWEVVPYTDHKFDVRETGGDGWAEINLIDTSNDEDFSLEYTPGTDAQVLVNVILAAAREDGDFGEAGRLDTRAGLTAWIGEGTHELLSERELMGIIALSNRVILLIGHAALQDETWDARLIDTYRTILWTIQPE